MTSSMLHYANGVYLQATKGKHGLFIIHQTMMLSCSRKQTHTNSTQGKADSSPITIKVGAIPSRSSHTQSVCENTSRDGVLIGTTLTVPDYPALNQPCSHRIVPFLTIGKPNYWRMCSSWLTPLISLHLLRFHHLKPAATAPQSLMKAHLGRC